MNPWEMDDVSLAAAVTGKNPWEMSEAEISSVVGSVPKNKPAPARDQAIFPGPFDPQDPLVAVLQQGARKVFPRTTAATMRGDQFAPWQAIQDVASIPGRAAMGALSAVGTEGEGLGKRFSESFGRTRADYSKGNIIPSVAEDVVRDPFTPLMLGVSSLIGAGLSKAPSVLRTAGKPALEKGLGEMGRGAVGAREAAQVAGEAVAGGFANQEGTFNPYGAAFGAAGGAPGAAKLVKDAPAWARVQTPRGVVEDLRNIIKPTPTMQKANKDALSALTLEEVMFKPSPYGAPLIQGVEDWSTLQDNLLDRLHSIAKKETDALSGPEFSTKVPAEYIFAQPMKAREKIPAKYSQSDRESLEEKFFGPFYDTYSSVVTRPEPGQKGNRDAAAELYNLMLKGDMPNLDFGDVPLSDAVSARKQLINAAKNRGKFSKADRTLSDEADAYTMSYQQLGDFIRASVPEGPGATAYREAQQDYARLLPWRDVLDQRVVGALGTKQRRDQTELGRIGLVGESMGLFKGMPEKVDISNAWKLYESAPAESAKKASLQSGGSQSSKANKASRVLSQMLRSANTGNRDQYGYMQGR